MWIRRGMTGEVSEVRRSGTELRVEWKIPGFLDLHCGDYEIYESPRFDFHDARWHLEVRPSGRCGAPGRVYFDLHRDGGSNPSTRTVTVSAGVRGDERRREEEERKFWQSDGWAVGESYTRRELREQMLMPDDALTFVCEMRVTGTTATGASIQTDDQFREPGTLSGRSQTLDRGSQTQQELPSDVLVTYSYEELQTATQDFSDVPLRDGGCKIGEGAFGTVYRAVIKGDVVAVKRLKDPVDKQLKDSVDKQLKDPVDKQFMTELRTLTNYKHKNLLSLVGFSLPTDGHQCCLLYEYMPNGSLQDRLACADGSEPLSWQTRLSVSYGTALGINHLHTFGEKPMVHRDIKSANILLDQNFVPKVGDFGLVRTGSRGVRSSTQVFTENSSGTLVYMPWEAFKSLQVSVKWDTFSFGVVLLELLTGLPPLDPNREDRDLVTHMELCEDIVPRLDPRADWNREAARELYGIARRRCLVQSWRSRSTISEILEDLRILSSAEKKTQRNTSFPPNRLEKSIFFQPHLI